jgi:6-phosphogluconate dehydrogenase
MVHNGIEQAHLSILCEVRSLLHQQLGFDENAIADIFEKWDANGELKGNYLVSIGAKA